MVASVDINSIAYDAPFAFEMPSDKWRQAKAREGTNRTKTYVPDADLSGKQMIVTGSNNGIGREAVLQFAEWGASVVLACRPNPPPHETHPDAVVEECRARARAAGHEKSEFEWWPLDMSSLASVEAFAARWLATGRAIDVLCNNAGMGGSPTGDKPFLTPDGFEIIHQVNFLSHVLLTLRLLPLVAAAPTPRIVCTTSCFHFMGTFDLVDLRGEKPETGGVGGVKFYQNNKLFYQTWLTELQRRMLAHPQYRHVTVNGVNPGYVNTGIWAMEKTVPWAAPKQFVLKLMAYMLGITPQQGSLAIVHAATSPDCGPDAKTQGVGGRGGRGGGRYINRVWDDEPMPHVNDPDCRCRIWRKVDEELQLQDKGLLDVLGLKSDE